MIPQRKNSIAFLPSKGLTFLTLKNRRMKRSRSPETPDLIAMLSHRFSLSLRPSLDATAIRPRPHIFHMAATTIRAHSISREQKNQPPARILYGHNNFPPSQCASARATIRQDEEPAFGVPSAVGRERKVWPLQAIGLFPSANVPAQNPEEIINRGDFVCVAAAVGSRKNWACTQDIDLKWTAAAAREASVYL